MAQDENFFSRWSQRKVQLARGGEAAVPAEAPAPVQVPVQVKVPAQPALQPVGQSGTHAKTPGEPQAETQAAPPPPPPTLEEARSLTPASDFRRFVGRDVDPEVKNAALKNLFSDPQFNVMDGLDIYIDDYGKPDPLPPGMLQRMAQSVFLGLVQPQAAAPESALAAEDAAPHPPAAQAAPEPAAELTSEPAATAPLHSTLPDPLDLPSDEDPDLRLQRHHEAGRPGAGEGPGPDPGRQR
jgi:hypothetical protein